MTSLIAAAVEELRASGNLTPTEVRRRAVEVLRDLAEADGAAWYVIREVDGRPRIVDWLVLATGPLSSLPDRLVHAEAPWPQPQDPTTPPRHALTSFVTGEQAWGPWEEIDRSPAWPHFERYYQPAKLRDQLRLLVYDGPRFVGWIGALRQQGSRGFGRSDVRRAKSLVAPLTAALVDAELRERAALPEHAADFVVRGDGVVEYSSDRGNLWLELPTVRERIGSLIRSVDRGGSPVPGVGMQLDWVRLTGARDTRYLVHVRRATPYRISPAASLSPTQRRVAEMAANGATVAEIAKALGCTPHTARSHLAAVYDRLGVGCRVELSRALKD